MPVIRTRYDLLRPSPRMSTESVSPSAMNRTFPYHTRQTVPGAPPGQARTVPPFAVALSAPASPATTASDARSAARLTCPPMHVAFKQLGLRAVEDPHMPVRAGTSGGARQHDAEPGKGLEPSTCRLQGGCSAS